MISLEEEVKVKKKSGEAIHQLSKNRYIDVCHAYIIVSKNQELEKLFRWFIQFRIWNWLKLV